MICPRCSVSEISPLTGTCELCGFAPVAAVLVEGADAVAELARRQLEHEFEFNGPVGRRDGTTVQRVVERSTGRDLVLKAILRPNAEPDAEESFRSTMNALAGFDHPNLVQVVRHGSTDSLFWFAAEDRGMTSLAALLAKDGPMELRACRRLLTQLAGALDYLHRHGFVHGAVKTTNVLVDHDGWVRLADVNFTRAVGRRTTPARNLVIGSRPSWVAPEEFARGERLPAADQYALAALAFECLTGAKLGSSLDAVAQLRSDVPARLVEAIERALDPDPSRRFSSCAEFVWALEQDVSTAATIASRPSGKMKQKVVMIRDWERAPDPKRTRLVAVQVVLGVLVIAAVIVGVPRLNTAMREAAAKAAARSAVTPVVRDDTTPTIPTTIPPVTGAEAPVSTEHNSALEPWPRGTPPLSAVTAPRPATLFVNTTPSGQLFVDGTPVGNTPRADVALTPGSHTIRVSRAGFATFVRTVRVSAGQVLRLTDIVLVPTQP